VLPLAESSFRCSSISKNPAWLASHAVRDQVLAIEGGSAFIAATAYTALAVSVFGHTVYFVLIRKYEANLIAALTLICPLMAIGLGVIITGDHFDGHMAIGTLVVFFGVLLIS
jgi:O-acetylserine/cysteine efflux transporter